MSREACTSADCSARRVRAWRYSSARTCDHRPEGRLSQRGVGHVLLFMAMEDCDLFERQRARLFGIAYRMLGDVADAEDLVQETFLRWHSDPRGEIASPEAWLVTVITRLAIDRLRKRSTERLEYPGDWLPEPIGMGDDGAADRAMEIASDLSIAFLVLLDRLSPPERAALLLRDVFDLTYAEIAGVLGKSEVASRQIIHRARSRVRGSRPRRTALPDGNRPLLERFLAALHAENRDELLAVLAPDATFTSDGGGKAPAARRVLFGRDRIARFLAGLEQKRPALLVHCIELVNGELAIVTRYAGRVFAVTAVDAEGDRITAFYRILNPDKLRRVGKDVVEAGERRPARRRARPRLAGADSPTGARAACVVSAQTERL